MVSYARGAPVHGGCVGGKTLSLRIGLPGYLAHKNAPLLPGQAQGPSHRPAVRSYEEALSCENPVDWDRFSWWKPREGQIGLFARLSQITFPTGAPIANKAFPRFAIRSDSVPRVFHRLQSKTGDISILRIMKCVPTPRIFAVAPPVDWCLGPLQDLVSQYCFQMAWVEGVQGYLTHQNTPPPLGPP